MLRYIVVLVALHVIASTSHAQAQSDDYRGSLERALGRLKDDASQEVLEAGVQSFQELARQAPSDPAKAGVLADVLNTKFAGATVHRLLDSTILTSPEIAALSPRAFAEALAGCSMVSFAIRNNGSYDDSFVRPSKKDVRFCLQPALVSKVGASIASVAPKGMEELRRIVTSSYHAAGLFLSALGSDSNPEHTADPAMQRLIWDLAKKCGKGCRFTADTFVNSYSLAEGGQRVWTHEIFGGAPIHKLRCESTKEYVRESDVSEDMLLGAALQCRGEREERSVVMDTILARWRKTSTPALPQALLPVVTTLALAFPEKLTHAECGTIAADRFEGTATQGGQPVELFGDKSILLVKCADPAVASRLLVPLMEARDPHDRFNMDVPLLAQAVASVQGSLPKDSVRIYAKGLLRSYEDQLPYSPWRSPLPDAAVVTLVAALGDHAKSVLEEAVVRATCLGGPDQASGYEALGARELASAANRTRSRISVVRQGMFTSEDPCNAWYSEVAKRLDSVLAVICSRELERAGSAGDGLKWLRENVSGFWKRPELVELIKKRNDKDEFLKVLVASDDSGERKLAIDLVDDPDSRASKAALLKLARDKDKSVQDIARAKLSALAEAKKVARKAKSK